MLQLRSAATVRICFGFATELSKKKRTTTQRCLIVFSRKTKPERTPRPMRRAPPAMLWRGASPSDWRGQGLPQRHPETAPVAGAFARDGTSPLRFPRPPPPQEHRLMLPLWAQVRSSDLHVRGCVQATFVAHFQHAVQRFQHRFRLGVSGGASPLDTVGQPSLSVHQPAHWKTPSCGVVWWASGFPPHHCA